LSTIRSTGPDASPLKNSTRLQRRQFANLIDGRLDDLDLANVALVPRDAMLS
jgi:hypothetical protein